MKSNAKSSRVGVVLGLLLGQAALAAAAAVRGAVPAAAQLGRQLLGKEAPEEENNNTSSAGEVEQAQEKTVEPWLLYAPGDRPTRVPSDFVLTNSTLNTWLRRTASPEENAGKDCVVIFTTTWLPSDPTEEIEMVSNFCAHLHRVGVLQHTLIFTVDDRSWELLHARGFPVVLDRAFPLRQAYLDGSGSAYRDNHGTLDTPNRVFDVQKHWWGATVIQHGYRAAYMDADAVVLNNPLAAFTPEYDAQALTDRGETEMGPIGSALHNSCSLYSQVKDDRVGTGSMLREWWRFQGEDWRTAVPVHDPCASTGVWFLEPVPAAVKFMGALRDRLLAPPTRHQWDQTAWNEVVVPFLWGVGDEPPLRFRLLPISQYTNIGPYEARMAAGLPVDLVVLHSGGLHGRGKSENYKRLGVWSPEFSLRSDSMKLGSSVKSGSVRAQTVQEAAEGARSSPAGWLLAATLVLTVLSLGAAAMVVLRRRQQGPSVLALQQLGSGRNGKESA